MSVQLGEKLQSVRSTKGLSLQAVSEPAKVSTGYLHKLEAGRVTSPNPRVLQRLADVLDVSYPDLMKRAGYLMPLIDNLEEPAGDAPERETPVESGGERAPTNDELMRLAQAIQAELTAVRERQDELARSVEGLPARLAELLSREQGSTAS